MKVAKFSQNLTACLLLLLLVGCRSTPPEVLNFNRSEAVKARINLALAYLEQHNFPKAKLNIDKALEHDHTDYLPHSVLAYYYQQTGNTSQAEFAYQTALMLSKKQTSDNQPRPDVQNNYGTFLCKQGQFEQAYQQFNHALESKQPYYYQADTLENILLCSEQEKDAKRFKQAFIQLQKIAPNRAEKWKSHIYL